MADPIDELTYQLDQMKLLGAVEGGQDLENLIEFLRNSHDGELPPVLFDWLFQLRRNLGALTQTDTAVLIQLNQPDLMEMVQRDDVLAKICQPLSDRTILVRSSNVTRLSRHLKTLGYLLG